MVEKIAVIGGLGTLSGGDLFFKLLKNKKVLKNQLGYHFIFEQQPYSQINLPLHQEEDIRSRKFYTYNVSKNFEKRDVTKILLPCFASHSFIDELQKEISITIVNIYDALAAYIRSRFSSGTRIGILTSDFVRQSKKLDEYFLDYELIFPIDQDKLMEAIYGKYGIKNGYFEGLSFEYIYKICAELTEGGCDIILPGITELSLITELLHRRGIQMIDVNQVYADYALLNPNSNVEKSFKIGILGGVGPSATVDFMNKIIQSTPAQKDQDHIKMVVEQNPQIPDRTANLIRQETDPTVAMFSTCKRLEAEGADAIAIPCNTAHAFVKDIQEHLGIPIINMLNITAEHILQNYGYIKVGLLATSGTLHSRVYHDVLNEMKLEVIIPDTKHQEYVMESIYGQLGVKAGFAEGICKEYVLKAADFLIHEGADVIILGCTELPLMFSSEDTIISKGRKVTLVDPTLILAKKIVDLSTVQ
ncbi:amino acid racemase [Chryseobacterium sp. PTM-20240506]|uniref:amino acid racemase n=1 Tax=unclassified Chryseobacterium TaxID=2593645 RepID=UPI0023599295|nr:MULTISPECIES: amino acid racemase [unclassified Chryseobacterium]MDC8103394.1 amino acid racemase [Chryseobacterium sp. B21-037]MDQ1802951.1 amino acid racemase [Chryseobacterium sp. CKR4-1]